MIREGTNRKGLPILTYTRVQKICIVGNTASGKSFLAQQAGVALDLPVFHLDQVYWQEDWSHLSREDFLACLEELTARAEWVIDGCFSEFGLQGRFAAADAVVFIDQPSLVCLKRAAARHKTVQEGQPTHADERKMSWRLSLAFMAEILLFRLLDRPRIMRAAQRTTACLFVIHEWSEEAQVLTELAKPEFTKTTD